MNQNYMTNRLIKETVDKNQKDYKEPKEDSTPNSQENLEEEPITAEISVKVTNSLNENVEGANVILTDNNEASYSCTTGKAGGCTIKNVPLGTYNVTTTQEDYKDKEEEFTVEKGTNNLNITLVHKGPSAGTTDPVIIEDGEL